MRSVEKYKDAVFYACLACACIALFVETFSFEKELGAASSAYGPEFFPRILLVVALLLIAAIAGRDFLRPTRTGATPSMAAPHSWSGFLRAAGLAGACAAGAFVWSSAGFLAGAGTFALGACILLRPSLKGILAIALFIPTAWFFFTRVFMVNL